MTAAQTLRDERDRALASGRNGGLEGTYLVEAGAGTGKTTVLVDRILNLVRSGTDITRIVAITFTEKAAAELSVRLRAELEEAIGRRVVSGGESAIGNVEEVQRDRLVAALHAIDRAHVSTIHGFCAALLKERPVEAGVDPNFGMVDALRQTLLLESVWGDWLRREFAGELPDAVEAARELGFGLRKIRELAVRLVNYRDLLHLVPDATEPGDIGSFIATIETEARGFVEIAAAHCTDPNDKAAWAVAEFERQVEVLAQLPEDVRGPYALRHLAPAPKKNKGRKGNWKNGTLDDLRTRAGALAERRDELRRLASHNAAVGLLGWIRGYVDAYDAEKMRLGLLDFQDLLSKARDLLRENLHVRSDFKRAYDRILVDEFQDTDPLQCEIVFFLAEEEAGKARDWTSVALEPGKLFIVGDPKQSIYRFRRADIEMYERAKEIISRQGEALTLVENFRTRPGIVEDVNAVFSEIMKPPEDGRRYQPEYAGLLPHREPDGKGPGTVLLTLSEPLDSDTKAPVIRRLEATAVAAFVADACRSGSIQVYDKRPRDWRPLELKDVAILFRSTTALEAYEDAFSDFGLDYRIAGGKKFYARREIKELGTVLAAVEDPHNGTAVVGALRTPFFGVSDEEILLHRHRSEAFNYLDGAGSWIASVEDSFALLSDLHAARNDAGVARLILRLFERTKTPELFLMKPGGEQRHANLMKVVELADALEKADPMSFGGFVHWLRDVSQLTPEEAESPLSEEGDDFVRMLTIHKAKGLEFPVTVLADLGRYQAHGESIIVDRGEARLALGIGRDSDRLATLDYDKLQELEKRRRDAELIRLLYVGATRARDALVIPWFVAGGDSSGSGLLRHFASLRKRAGAPVADLGAADGDGRTPVDLRDGGVIAFDSSILGPPPGRRRPLRLRTDEAAEIDPETTDAHTALTAWEAWRSDLGRHLNKPPIILSPSGLAAGPERRTSGGTASSERTARRLESAAGEEPPRGPSGAQLGTLVHSVMERLDLDQPAAALPLARALARTQGLDECAADAAATIIARSLESTILVRARASKRSWWEVPFCVVRNGRTLEGKMDLVFEEDDGYVVVDYKTDAFDDDGPSALATHYEAQACAYGLALATIVPVPVKEVVLLFMQGPAEVSVPIASRFDAPDRELERILAEADEETS
jgi:ATP-dependent helicase/nuclease subunit A